MHDRIRANRRVCAALWAVVFVLAAIGVVGASQAASIAVVGSLIIAILTFPLGMFEAEEWLARPIVYRAIAGVWLAVSLAGVVLALVPEASSTSRVFGFYFGAVSVLAYRAVVARGPSRGVSGVVLSILLWFPLIFVLVNTDHGHHHVRVHWTEEATLDVLRVFALVLPIVAAATLVAFVPRQDLVPVARVVRSNGA